MRIYVERFVLPLIVAVVALLVVSNLYKLDVRQRVALFVAAAALAYLVATLVDPMKPPAQTLQREPLKSVAAAAPAFVPDQHLPPVPTID